MPVRRSRFARSGTRPFRSPSQRLGKRRPDRIFYESRRSECTSPRWGSSTKLLVGLTIVGVMVALLANMRFILGPILLAVFIAYLMYPLAQLLYRRIKTGWRWLVSVLYLLVFLVTGGLLTWGGFALVDQIQSLIRFVETVIREAPMVVQGWIDSPPVIGPFVLDLGQLDLMAAANQALAIIQPVLGRLGTMIGSLATGAASTVGWIFFSILLSYFIVSETGGKTENILRINIPGYTQDMQNLVRELGIIWNAFLRGQLAIFGIVFIFYLVIFIILGVNYFWALALLAGAGRFVPYIGQWIGWGVMAIVASSQGSTLFGLSTGMYVLVVFLAAFGTDSLIDNLVAPRIFSRALKIHPAAVMVAAIVGLNLIGLMGVLLAAPVMATIKLVLDYLFSKLMDQDPWMEISRARQPRRVDLMVWDAFTGIWSQCKQKASGARQWFSRLAGRAFKSRQPPL